MHFTKMHGQGNDFVMIGFSAKPDVDFPALSVEVCDRHKGVGADGLIATLPSENCDFKMRIFNPDGSEPGMCGNGVRCAVKYYVERVMDHEDGKIADGEITLAVETLAGVRAVTTTCVNGKTGDLSVDMGEPILDPARIPVKAEGARAVNVALEAAGRSHDVTCVSMGNPHAVIFIDGEPDDYDVARYGAALERHPAFPQKANVEFAKIVRDGDIKMRVWERGVGETLACGTGACATLVAAHLNGLCGRDAVLHLRGGDLNIAWAESGRVRMTGGATIVFDGELPDK